MVLDQDNDFYLKCLSILLNNVWILQGEDRRLSLLGVKGLNVWK